jgi:hypothetical protein
MSCPNELNHVETSLRFAKPPSPTKHIHERARWTELEGHVDIFIVFETILEVNNIGMFERSVNLDFGVKLKKYISESLME